MEDDLDLEKNSEQPKNYYTEYRSHLKDLEGIEKKINTELGEYKKKMNDSGINIEMENKIKGLLKEYKDKKDNLAEAYSSRNIPSGFPFAELDKRQKEIQQLGFNYDKMANEYKAIENERYKFKGGIDEDYSKKEEYKFMNRDELLTLQKNKLNKQDEQIEDITVDVKKNTQLEKNAKHVIKDQNKQLEQINEDIDRTKEKMGKLTDRFKNYASSISWCKLIFIIIIELVIALGAYLLLFD